MLLLLALTSGSALAADCPKPISISQLDAEARTLVTTPGPTAAALIADVECADALLVPADAAIVHLALGIQWFREGDLPDANGAFAAARTLDPNVALPAQSPPELVAAFQGTQPVSAAVQPLPIKSPLEIWVDGVAATSRATPLAQIVQVSADHRVIWSAYALPGRDLDIPAYLKPTDLHTSAASSKPVKPPKEPRPPPEPKPPRKPAPAGVWIGAASAAVVAGGLFGVAAYERTQFDDTPTELGFHLINDSWAGSVGFGIAALGLTTVAVVVRF